MHLNTAISTSWKKQPYVFTASRDVYIHFGLFALLRVLYIQYLESTFAPQCVSTCDTVQAQVLHQKILPNNTVAPSHKSCAARDYHYRLFSRDQTNMEMPVHRPVARRNFEVTPASTPSTHPSSPTPENTNPELLMDKSADGLSSPSRNRSILNLTTSTLSGIYSGTTSESGREELSTPWGTGAQTPAPRTSIDSSRPDEPTWDWNSQIIKPAIKPRRRRTGIRRYYLPLALQTALLAGFGVAFGAIIAHLQESRSITPVPVLVIDNKPTYYHLSWALFGILLGNALPVLDDLWAEKAVQEPSQPHSHHRSTSSVSESSQPSESSLGPLWYSVVRSIGAFVGIAFAVRKLHWQSTLQLSMTLALANPVLWYLIDRSIPGFAFSSIVGLAGTIILLLVNPNFVPVPAIHQTAASEQVGVFTWLLSILFCTSLCFGAIGRKLHL